MTDADGVFSLALPAGEQLIDVSADGYSDEKRRVFSPSTGVTIVLTPASSITGKVLSALDGTALDQLEVRAVNIDGLNMMGRTAVTSEDGVFTLGRLPAGEYSLVAVSAAWRSAEQTVSLGVADAAGPVVLHAQPATTFTAAVSVDGAPCTRGWVHLDGPVFLSEAVQAPEATVTLEGALPGSYSVVVLCPPGVRQTAEIEIGSAPMRRSWDLRSGLTVRGLVETPEARPLSDVEVIVEPTSDGPELPSSRCSSDARGEFSCTGLGPGEHAVWPASVLPTPANIVRVVLDGGPAPFVKLRSPGTARLVVDVAGTTDIDLAQVELGARRSDGPPHTARLGAEGFVFEHLELGEYEIRWLPSSETAGHATLSDPGQVVKLELAPPPSDSISGRVVDANGVSVVDAWVRAFAKSSPVAGAASGRAVMTDPDGEFTISGLVPGRYDLEASATGDRARIDGIDSGAAALVLRLVGESR